MEQQFEIHNPKPLIKHNKGHGRVETRELQVMDVPRSLRNEWPGVQQILKITRKRFRKGKETTAVAYGITSLSKEKAPPERIMEIWRDHWKIENQLHWVRDVVFNEDRSTIKKGDAPQVMAALKNLSIAAACKMGKSVTDMRCHFARFHKQAIKFIKEN